MRSQSWKLYLPDWVWLMYVVSCHSQRRHTSLLLTSTVGSTLSHPPLSSTRTHTAPYTCTLSQSKTHSHRHSLTPHANPSSQPHKHHECSYIFTIAHTHPRMHSFSHARTHCYVKTSLTGVYYSLKYSKLLELQKLLQYFLLPSILLVPPDRYFINIFMVNL